VITSAGFMFSVINGAKTIGSDILEYCVRSGLVAESYSFN